MAYRAMGAVVENTRFIPFKTPLREEILVQIREDDQFGIDTLHAEVKPRLDDSKIVSHRPKKQVSSLRVGNPHSGIGVPGFA